MRVKVYGADWCSDCIQLKKYLHHKGTPFEYIIITDNKLAINFLEKANNGKRIIPTIDVDGKVYANPGISELMKILP
tara:strand:+ start:878 stop:1108 length:231 start_codon:yes stop_codon:yes gene_type:complete